jgi:hypothetical protein
MLYKFKSKATGDLIMLEPQGKQILTLIGKDAGAQGIIMPNEMLAAIDALHAAVAQEELAYEEAKQLAQDATKTDSEQGAGPANADGPRGIRLKQRVVPFIDMLRRAHAEDKEVVWGV